jgi:hypothetical protein
MKMTYHSPPFASHLQQPDRNFTQVLSHTVFTFLTIYRPERAVHYQAVQIQTSTSHWLGTKWTLSSLSLALIGHNPSKHPI